jgi:asparagine synthase (glutamine-hydrolysing)
LRSWIRGPLAGLVDDLLAGSSMRSRELYEPKHVREVILRDRAGLEDNALVIWTFLTNELWFRTHFG